MGPGYARALTKQQRDVTRGRSQKMSFASILYQSLALSGWLATTALATAGLFVILFLLAGNGTLGGLFEQLDLLARHYLTAEPVRRAAFEVQLLAIVGIVFATTAFFRRAALIAIFKTGGGRWTT